MNKEDQEKIVKIIVELENNIERAEKKLHQVYSESFRSIPVAPEQQFVIRDYPIVKPDVKYNFKKAFFPWGISFVLFVLGMLIRVNEKLFWLNSLIGAVSMLIGGAGTIWVIYYSLVLHKNEKKEDVEKKKQSADYKNKCAILDKSYDEQQEKYNEEYKKLMTEYNKIILPEYKSELEIWTKKHNENVLKLKEFLKVNKEKLEMVYSKSKIIPVQYRNLPALNYIYDMMSTSDYDIQQAIQNYDKKLQRDLDEVKIKEQQISNQLADEQADLLARQNEIAERARRDANIAAMVGSVQRHNVSKNIKDINEKLK